MVDFNNEREWRKGEGGIGEEEGGGRGGRGKEEGEGKAVQEPPGYPRQVTRVAEPRYVTAEFP